MDEASYVAGLTGEAQLDSSAAFTLDPVAALRKYSTLQTQEPALFVLLLVQVGIQLGASAVEVRNLRNELGVRWRFDGPRPDVDGFADPAGWPPSLALALQLALAADPAQVQIAFRSPQRSWTRDALRGALTADAFSPEVSLSVVVQRRRNWLRLKPDAAVQKALSARFSLSPVSVSLDGRTLNSGNYARLHGLPQDVMPRGSFLQRNYLDSSYAALGVGVRLSPSDRPAIAAPPPFLSPTGWTRLEGSSSLFERGPRDTKTVAEWHWDASDGPLKVEQVTERAAPVEGLSLSVIGKLSRMQGTPPRDGALWVHSEQAQGGEIWHTHYLPDTRRYWLPGLQCTHRGRYQTRDDVSLRESYFARAKGSPLLSLPMLNADRVFLLRPLPAPEALIFFVRDGLLLNPVRLPNGPPGMVAILPGHDIATDAGLLSPVYDEHCQLVCERTAAEFAQWCKPFRPLVTTISALNLPQPTIELWRTALK